MKLNFSEPKIYTGSVDISQWSRLSTNQQKDALSKDWYIYYSFRDIKTGNLKRQPNIKAGANRYKNKSKRYQFLKILQKNLLLLLESGFNPYKDHLKLVESLLNTGIEESNILTAQIYAQTNCRYNTYLTETN
ncbi:MAG: hypothetical protein DRI75_10570 [Bacteroidetes bacterium]|nr:MAG: hypothetical protein DRI75_10570 [Bacteroidota bacterium]